MIKPEYVYRFDTIDSYLNTVTTCERHGDHGRTENYDFTMTYSFEEALNLARKGWADGAKQAREFRGYVSEAIQTQHVNKGTWRKTLTGGGVRVPAYIQGRPDCFLSYKQIRDTKFVTLVYTGGASGSISPKILMKKGLMTAAVVDLLESQNIRVKLILAYANNNVTELYVTLKEHSESLDIDRIAFWIGHPSAFRRIRFAFYETIENSEIRQAGNGQGQSENPTEQGDIFIPRSFTATVEPQWATIDSSINHVRGLLAAKGITL